MITVFNGRQAIVNETQTTNGIQKIYGFSIVKKDIGQFEPVVEISGRLKNRCPMFI